MSDINFEQVKQDTQDTVDILGLSRSLTVFALVSVVTISITAILLIGLDFSPISAISLGISFSVISIGFPLSLYLREITQP